MSSFHFEQMKSLMLLWVACKSIAPVDDDASASSLPTFVEYFDLETFEVWEVTDIYLLTHSAPGLDILDWPICRHFIIAVDSVNGDACPVCPCLQEDVSKD